jgi:hypothetical protein
MDPGVAVLLLAVIGLPVLYFWMIVRSSRRAARKVGAAEDAYLASLDLLRTSPLDPRLREETLALGRAYIEVRSRHGLRKGFSELALSNDINAACAHAVNHPGAVAKVAVVNAGSLSTDSVAKQIEDLNNLRRSGVLSDDGMDSPRF